MQGLLQGKAAFISGFPLIRCHSAIGSEKRPVRVFGQQAVQRRQEDTHALSVLPVPKVHSRGDDQKR